MGRKVCILDYGSGNVRSVLNLLSTLADVAVSNEAGDIRAASHIVLPGVGSFGASMQKIRDRIPIDVLSESVSAGKPFLGICVGMQVLAQVGYEFGEHQGLGWIPGKVQKLDCGSLPLPHIGWNDVETSRANSILSQDASDRDFYFVHSYVMAPEDPAAVVATCTYGTAFPAIVVRENIIGVQFHPEKSQRAGVTLLKEFLKL